MNNFYKPLSHPLIQDGYMLSCNGYIKSSLNDSIKPYYPSYHSSNGYDYESFVLKDGTLQLFPIDDLLCHTFIPIPDELINKHIKVNHIDGNNKNNCIDNLEWIEDVEEWKTVTYPGVKEDMYEISNWGRIKNKNTGMTLRSFHSHKYMVVGLSLSTIGQKHFFIHRLVSYEFHNSEYNEKYDVNHINGNPEDNQWKNLEWVSRSTNITHAIYTGLNKKLGTDNPSNKFEENTVVLICELLVKFKGDIQIVLNTIIDMGITNVSRWNIERIKYKRNWKWISDKYFDIDDFPSMCKHNKVVLNEKYVEMICKSLLTNDMRASKTFYELKETIPGLTESQIYKIKRKYNWRNVSDKFF